MPLPEGSRYLGFIFSRADDARRGGGGPARGPSPPALRHPLSPAGRRARSAEKERRHEHRAGVRARLQPAGRRRPWSPASRRTAPITTPSSAGTRDPTSCAPCSSGCSARAATTPGRWSGGGDRAERAAAEWTFSYVVTEAIPRSAGRKVRFRGMSLFEQRGGRIAALPRVLRPRRGPAPARLRPGVPRRSSPSASEARRPAARP